MNVVFGRHPVAEALKAGAPISRIIVAAGMKPSLLIDEIRDLALSSGIPVVEKNRRHLDELTGNGTHQGIVAVVPEFSYVERSAIVGDGPCRLVLLDGITDHANLGSIFRSADAFGWTGLMLPSRRSAGVTPAVRKVAAGAAERIPVARIGSAAEAVSWLKDREVWVVSLHPEADESYEGFSFPERVCLVVGAEGRGLSRLVRERSDALIRIPMEGSLASINAGVAAAIVMAREASKRRSGGG